MNKRYFIALVATFFMALGAIAQTGNTYSMVLTLKGGTVVTIGPNDLEKIDFSNETMTVSGKSITELIQQIADLQLDMNATKANVTALQASVAKNSSDVMAVKENLSAGIASSKVEMKAYTDEQAATLRIAVQASITDKINAAKAEQQKYTNNKVDESKAELQEYINVVHKDINSIANRIEAAERYLQDLTTLINSLEGRVTELENK